MSNPSLSNRPIRGDSEYKYAWKDIEEAQKFGFKECKKKILKILDETKLSYIPEIDKHNQNLIKQIEKL